MTDTNPSKATSSIGGVHSLGRIAAAVVLFTASLLKFVSYADGSYSTLFLLHAIVEFCLAIWLFAGIGKWASVPAASCLFLGYVGVALHSVAMQKPDCGCMGAVPTPPWLMVLLDSTILGCLIWPPNSESHSRGSVYDLRYVRILLASALLLCSSIGVAIVSLKPQLTAGLRFSTRNVTPPSSSGVTLQLVDDHKDCRMDCCRTGWHFAVGEMGLPPAIVAEANQELTASRLAAVCNRLASEPDPVVNRYSPSALLAGDVPSKAFPLLGMTATGHAVILYGPGEKQKPDSGLIAIHGNSQPARLNEAEVNDLQLAQLWGGRHRKGHKKEQQYSIGGESLVVSDVWIELHGESASDASHLAITNEGTKQLEVVAVGTSCQCVMPGLTPNSLIMPGERLSTSVDIAKTASGLAHQYFWIDVREPSRDAVERINVHIVSLSGINAEATPHALHFGTLNPGESVTRTLTIREPIDALSDGPRARVEFRLDGIDASVVASGQSTTDKFIATTYQVTCKHDDSSINKTVNGVLTLVRSGVTIVSVSMVATHAPRISLSPSALLVGRLKVGNCASHSITVDHAIAKRPIMMQIEACPEWASVKMPSEGGEDFIVSVAPLKAGDFSGKVIVKVFENGEWSELHTIDIAGTAFN